MGKPEKLVENQIVAHLRSVGWSVEVIESKAEYSKALKMYRKSRAVREGFSDLCCVMPNGRAAFIELKAPNKAGTVRAKQLGFLQEKMRYGAFVCVAWSLEQFEALFKDWLKNPSQREAILQGHLQSLKVVLQKRARRVCL